MEDWIGGDLSIYEQYNKGRTFHWWDVKHQNYLMEDAFARSRLWNLEILDAYDLITMRSDHQGVEP